MGNSAIQHLLDTGSPTFELLNIQIGSDDFSQDLRRDRAGVVHRRAGVVVASRTWKQAKVWNLNINVATEDYIVSLRPFFEAGAFYLYPDIDDPGTKYTVFWDNDSFDPKYISPDQYSLKATFKESTVGAGIPTYIGGSQDQVINGDLDVNGNLDVSGTISINGVPIDSGGGSGDHNDTTNIQGGTTNEYYHLTADEYSNLDVVPASGVTPGTFGSGTYTFSDSLSINGPSLDIDKDDDGTGVLGFCNSDASLVYVKASSTFTATKSLNILGDIQTNGTNINSIYAPINHNQNASTIEAGTFPNGNYTFNNGVINIHSSTSDTPLKLNSDGDTVCAIAMLDTNGTNYVVSEAGAGGHFHWTIDGTNRMQLEANGDLQIDGTMEVGNDLKIVDQVGIGDSGTIVANDLVHLNTVNHFSPVTSNTTVYQKAMSIEATETAISNGVTDSGYRIGLSIDSYLNTSAFAGTLDKVYGIWSRVGTNTDNPTGTINLAAAVYADTLVGANSTITNLYGIYQPDSGQTKNWFNGNTGVGGDPTGNYQFEVFGSTHTTGGALIDGTLNSVVDIQINGTPLQNLFAPLSHANDTGNPHVVQIDDILPSQTGEVGKVLKTNGNYSYWGTDDTGAGGFTLSKGASLPGPESGDFIPLFYTDVALTITQTNSAVIGTGSTVWNLHHHTHLDTTGGPDYDVWNSAKTETDEGTGTEYTSFDDATVPAGRWVYLKITSVTGTVDMFHVTLQYTED